MTLPIINFHGLGNLPAWVEEDEARYWLTEGQYCEALDLLNETASKVAITFDDGNTSDLEIGLPALKKRGLNGEFFVCSAKLGKRGYLDAEAIRTLSKEARGVGSHGRLHKPWRGLSDKELKREIAGSKDELEDILGHEVRAAALPFGQYDRASLAELRRARYQRVYSSDGLPRLTGTWLQPRYSIRGDIDIRQQVQKLLGDFDWTSKMIQEARMRVKALR